jgi:hypothetical protein
MFIRFVGTNKTLIDGQYQFVVTYEDQLSSDYWTKPTEWHIDGQEWAGETDDDEQASLAVAANDVHEPAEMKADSLEATTTQVDISICITSRD